MKMMFKKIIFSFLMFLLSTNFVFAGQEKINTAEETKTTLGDKLNQCLKLNTTNINNFRNLELLYANLLDKDKSLEERLKASLEVEKKLKERILQLENENKTAESLNLVDNKKQARYALVLLVVAIILFALYRLFVNQAKYNLVAEKYTAAKIFGALSFAVLGLSILATIIFLYIISMLSW